MSLGVFVNEYSYEAAKQWCRDTESYLVIAVISYVTAIWSIKFIMKDRKPFEFQYPLIIWNAILAAFSILGFVYVTPVFLKVIYQKGLSFTYTDISEIHTDKVAGYWTFLWVASKTPEFLDTIFIVLRKKPLMFMHWYHHALTGYFAAVNFYEDNAYMVWVCWLNYFIHSFMYSYYMLRALRIKVPPQVAQLITSAQIVQFLITHAVMIHLGYLVHAAPRDYAVTRRGYAIGAFMEFTYLLLWFRFYYISYYRSGGKKYVQAVQTEVKKTE